MTPQDMLARAFTKMNDRALVVQNRYAWYSGEHPCEFSNTAWDKTFRAQLQALIENQCKTIIDKRSGPLVPSSFTAREAGVVADTNALWVTEQVAREADKVRKAVRAAKWSGTQSILIGDYDWQGNPVGYTVDPRNGYAEVTTAGEVLWVAFTWTDADDFINATVLTPEASYPFSSRVRYTRPAVGAFTPGNPVPNRLGYVPAAVFDERESLIDQLWPLNSALNTAHQVQHVLGNKAANPTTIWWGLQVLDTMTGQVTGPKPNINPATGASDIAIPIGADETGTARRVEQLASRSPAEWEAIKAGFRAACWTAGQVPAALMDIGGGHPSADALEASAVMFTDVVNEDRQIYDGPLSRFAAILTDLRALKLTGRPAGLTFDVQFSNLESSTATQQVTRFKAAVDAGMAIADAAVLFLGKTPEEAEKLQENADASKARAVAVAGSQFLAGL